VGACAALATTCPTFDATCLTFDAICHGPTNLPGLRGGGDHGRGTIADPHTAMNCLEGQALPRKASQPLR